MGLTRSDLQISTGSVAFSIAAAICGIPADAADVSHRFGAGGVFGVPEMLRAAKAMGLRARPASPALGRLGRCSMPAIARDLSGEFFVVGRVITDDSGVPRQFMIQRPGLAPMALSPAAFESVWDGSLILMARRAEIGDPSRPFGLSWFYSAIFRYRRILSEVLVVSFALQILGLATPLFFQVIVDKVLVHHGFSTLNVVGIGLGLVIIFEVVLGGLRSYLFSHTTNRIDVELSARLFHHLLRLPLDYFSARRVGDSVARVRELENIRQFLTGSTLTLLLDTVFGALFLVIIFCYSMVLGWIVSAGIPLYVLISVFATPAIRQRVQEKFRRGAENQSFLVETVSGIETLKAMAVEPQMQLRWEEQLSGYVRSAFRVSTLAIFASQGAQLISRGTTLAVLFVGANLVMQDHLTIGELIAVNMLAGQLSSPILRLAQLWQDFQQVRVSVERVGDILNSAAEPQSPPGSAARPAITGGIAFNAVSFRYQASGPRVLDELSLTIPPGQVIGVVGPSGSGKSTLTRLVQRLCTPESGRLTIDGFDLNVVDTSWLRRQIGVVLQESILFNASIRDNIALRDPAMSMDRVVRAARLAGAEAFIAELPAGYETQVGERGARLSGGQRQRIAIARALALDPRILIFDEATSALDLESEQAIQANMREICRDRTVMIVAHRLSALRNAERIVTIEKGRVTEDGVHADLVRAGGRYAHLWAAQTLGAGTAAVFAGADR